MVLSGEEIVARRRGAIAEDPGFITWKRYSLTEPPS